MGVAGGVSQLLPAGTQWAVEFANNTIWLFSGGGKTDTMSDLSYSIVQPLLFTAGRKVGLEGLTQAERALLYEARVLARFRQQLFTGVVAGAPGASVASAFGVSGATVGFLQLCQQQQQIRNQRGNISRLEEQIERLLAMSARNELFANTELPEWPANAPRPEQLPLILLDKLRYDEPTRRLRWEAKVAVTDEQVAAMRNLSDAPVFQEAVTRLVTTLRTKVATLDVLQLQSQLANSTNTLRSQETTFQDGLDNFKLLLGLRTDTKLTIDMSMLDRFQIVDPRLSMLEQKGKDFVTLWGALPEEDLDLEQMRQIYAQFLALVDDVTRDGMGVVVTDFARVKQALPRRLEELNSSQQEQLKVDLDRVQALLDFAQDQLQDIRDSVFEAAKTLQEGRVDLPVLKDAYKKLNNLREDLVQLTQNLTVVQLSLRLELIDVQPFEMAQQTAVSLAMENRVDLMNARALVMDARRKVEIAANALLASMNLVANGDINTPTDNKPFDFRGSQSRIRVGISFTAPLDQIDERNAYRQSLILYQRQRRAYMLAEDQVKQNVRVAWRQLFLQRQNLETARRAVRIAALQYDSAVEASNAPTAAAGGSTSGRSGSGVSGNLILTALNQMLTAQNNLIQTWIAFEQNRLNIYRDMGIMMIGEDGLWDDPLYQSQVNDNVDPALRPNPNLAPDLPAPPGTGRSGLGRGAVDPGLVAIPDGFELEGDPQEPDYRAGQARGVSGQPERAGLSR
jgi:outer membrane protein TolC